MEASFQDEFRKQYQTAMTLYSAFTTEVILSVEAANEGSSFKTTKWHYDQAEKIAREIREQRVLIGVLYEKIKTARRDRIPSEEEKKEDMMRAKQISFLERVPDVNMSWLMEIIRFPMAANWLNAALHENED